MYLSIKICTILLFSGISVIAFPQTKTITTDDFPITDEMLRNHQDIVIDEIHSLDKVWFRNANTDEVLVIELGTDLYRNFIFYFDAKEVSDHFLKKLEFHTIINNAYMQIGINEKQATLSKFIYKAKIISPSYFNTKKEISMDSNKEVFVKAYGNPDKCEFEKTFEVCSWRFEGNLGNSGSHPVKPLAENSFDYEVTGYFKEGKLKAMILYNAIP